MSTAKRLVMWLAVGALTGDFVALLLGTQAITWFISLPATSSLCNCVEASQRTADALLKWQLAGAALGAVSFIVVGELGVRSFGGWRKRRAERAALKAAEHERERVQQQQADAAKP